MQLEIVQRGNCRPRAGCAATRLAQVFEEEKKRGGVLLVSCEQFQNGLGGTLSFIQYSGAKHLDLKGDGFAPHLFLLSRVEASGSTMKKARNGLIFQCFSSLWTSALAYAIILTIMQKYTGFLRVILDVQKNPLVSDDPEV